VAAACGDDDDGSSSGATTTAAGATTTGAGATTTAGGATTTAGGATTTASGGGQGGLPPACEPDDSVDAVEGTNAGQFLADLQCAIETPMKAEGEPIIIGMQNSQGDPNGSFPEYTAAIEAAAEFINEELGGLGANVSEGRPGRPIQLETCFMAINPADSQKCANELAGKDPFAVISTLNFFGNHFPIYQQAGTTVLVSTPITVGDFTSEGVYSVGAGGGCLGVHTGLVYASTQFLEAKRVAVPWADTPPGVVCYYDLEKKPLDVIQGSVPGDSELAGSMPDLEHIGVPIKPATPDVTPQVTQVLDFDPEVIVFSGQGADCWNLVDGLGRAGWTPEQTPLILSTACLDLAKMRERPDLAPGIKFVGSAGASLSSPDSVSDPRLKFESQTYVDKGAQFGMEAADITKGFAGAGWSVMMTLYEQTGIVVNDGKELTAENFKAQIAGTDGNHLYGSVPFGCAGAPAPYTAVCSSEVSFTEWDGEKMVVIEQVFSGLDLIAGTELKPGP
jgi:branched-chain amino acid transport system substrate-binding protein